MSAFVVKISTVKADGKRRVTVWSRYRDALDAEQTAARLRSFGWCAWAARAPGYKPAQPQRDAR